VGSQPLHRGWEGVGEEEEPRSDASSQVESEGSEPPPTFFNLYGVAVQCLFCRYYLFPVQPSSKTHGSQTYKNHLVVRTPIYRHTTIIAH
jgi:hypothetical protein